jgi:hypothetical protein
MQTTLAGKEFQYCLALYSIFKCFISILSSKNVPYLLYFSSMIYSGTHLIGTVLGSKILSYVHNSDYKIWHYCPSTVCYKYKLFPNCTTKLVHRVRAFYVWKLQWSSLRIYSVFSDSKC